MKEKENKAETISIPDEVLMGKIYQIRGQKVMLDSDLSELYGVENKRLTVIFDSLVIIPGSYQLFGKTEIHLFSTSSV